LGELLGFEEEVLVPGGRGRSEVKGTLFPVGLPEGGVRLLHERAHQKGVSPAEALRRFMDEYGPAQRPRAGPPTTEDRKGFDQVFATLGLGRRRGTSRPRR